MSGFWLGEPEEPRRGPTLKEIYDDLGTRTDVCRALDITEARMRKWLERRSKINCPQPVKRFGHTDVYSITEWKAWYGNWLARFDPERWRDTKRHGSGENFFTYFR